MIDQYPEKFHKVYGVFLLYDRLSDHRLRRIFPGILCLFYQILGSPSLYDQTGVITGRSVLYRL